MMIQNSHCVTIFRFGIVYVEEILTSCCQRWRWHRIATRGASGTAIISKWAPWLHYYVGRRFQAMSYGHTEAISHNHPFVPWPLWSFSTLVLCLRLGKTVG